MGTVQADTTAKDLATTTTGGLVVSDEGRDRNASLGWTSIISNTAIGLGAADSSSVINTSALRHLMFCMKVVPASNATVDTISIVRFAVQFRVHVNSQTDSASTFPVYFYASSLLGQSATPNDTSLAGHLVHGTASIPWSGEYTLTFARNRVGVYNAIAATGFLFNYPSGVAIPLDGLFGRDVYFPNLSIRVRNMGPAAGNAQVVAWLNGSPL